MPSLLKDLRKNFDPDNQFLYQALRTVVSATIAIFISRFLISSTQGYWLVLSSIFILQARSDTTLLYSSLTICSVGVLSALSSLIIAGFTSHPILLGAYLFFITFICSYLSQLGLTILISSFFINLFAVMSGGLIASSIESVERFFIILLGTLIALVSSYLFSSSKIKRWSHSVNIYYRALRDFTDLLDDTINPGKKLQHTFSFLFHENRVRCLLALKTIHTKTRLIENTNVATHHVRIETSCKKMFTAFMGLACLWPHIIRKKELVVCYPILRNVMQELSFLYLQKAEGVQKISPETLTMSIENLKEKTSNRPEHVSLLILLFLHFIENIRKELFHD